ncbi:MAG: ATP-grasp domain-containing protein [Gammaproteobacteria bacterium]
MFVEVLARLVKEHHIDILLPMTELTTTLLLTHKDAFPGIVIPFPEMSRVDALANKCTLMRTAESLGIPVPRTWYVDDPATIPDFKDAPSFPAVLKPGRSWLRLQDQWQRSAVKFPVDESALNSIIDSDPAFHTHPFMIQEYVAGHGQGVFALYNQGKPLAFFSHRRLREKPPGGGVSVLSESITTDPALVSHARSLLDKVGWHGVAMVEFKVAPDGAPYLMEINTRFWGSLQLAIDAGVDFPYLLYQLACGENPDPVDSYKTGIRLRWLLGDLDSLYLTLKDQHTTSRAKLMAVMRFLTPSPFKTRHEVNRWNDPGPCLCELREYLRDIIR